jgi:hypothetical protein
MTDLLTWAWPGAGPYRGLVSVSVTGESVHYPPDIARKLAANILAAADEADRMAKRWCDHCGGAVRPSTVIPDLWVHEDEALWAAGAHRVRLRKIEGEPE